MIDVKEQELYMVQDDAVEHYAKEHPEKLKEAEEIRRIARSRHSKDKTRIRHSIKPNTTKSISNEVLFSCPDHGQKLAEGGKQEQFSQRVRRSYL